MQRKQEGIFSVSASIDLDIFVETVYRHYAKLPSLGNMDQWAMNKALNVIRDAPVSDLLENGWQMRFEYIHRWSKINSSDGTEIIPISLKGPRGETYKKVCDLLERLGVCSDDIEKLCIFSLFDRLYHDDEGKMDLERLMPHMFDYTREQVKYTLLSVPVTDVWDFMQPDHLDAFCEFGNRKKAFLKVFPRTKFRTAFEIDTPRPLRFHME